MLYLTIRHYTTDESEPTIKNRDSYRKDAADEQNNIKWCMAGDAHTIYGRQ